LLVVAIQVITIIFEKLSNTIKIGDYKFAVPAEFELIVGKGIDSYIGKVVEPGISLTFDFGWFTRPLTNLSTDKYEVIENNVGGHFKQIVKPLNPELNLTRLHIYKIDDFVNHHPYGYNSLTMSTYNLTDEEYYKVLFVIIQIRRIFIILLNF